MTYSSHDELSFRQRILQSETDAILDDPTFRRSPTLSKLLQFLVNEAIAGRGDTLKSYAVAVDALGRPDDYDPSSDSSARVQMTRLRKALESYYSKNAPTDKLCLYLQSGSYLIRLNEPSLAYPALYRLNADAAPVKAPDPPGFFLPKSFIPAAPDNQLKTSAFNMPLRWTWKNWRIALFVAVAATAVLIALFNFFKVKSGPEYISPVLTVMPIVDGGRPEVAALSAYLRSVFEDDLPRFKLARIRLVEDQAPSKEVGTEVENYRLNSRLVQDDEISATLFLNINDVKSDTVLWTRKVSLPLDPTKANAMIIPYLAEVNGPIGAIALHQTNLKHSSNESGYPCMLKYFEFIRTRAPGLEDRLAHCLEQPVNEDFIAATMMGIRGMFELERPASQKDFRAATARGTAFARQGINLDPNDAWSNFAMARLSYAAGDCVSALSYSVRTMEANANSPIFPAVLASLSPVCKNPNADKLLDQALITQSPLYIRSRLLLVQAAIYNNRPDAISRIKESELPETDLQKRYYYATETFIAASKGQTAEANKNWRFFIAVSDPDAATADAKMSSIIIIPAMRAQALDYLRDAGVIL